MTQIILQKYWWFLINIQLYIFIDVGSGKSNVCISFMFIFETCLKLLYSWIKNEIIYLSKVSSASFLYTRTYILYIRYTCVKYHLALNFKDISFSEVINQEMVCHKLWAASVKLKAHQTICVQKSFLFD